MAGFWRGYWTIAGKGAACPVWPERGSMWRWRGWSHAPGAVQLQEWKDSRSWFFRQQREWERSSVDGVPPLGERGLGQADWERRLIERVRTLDLTWRAEQTCRDWNWRLAKLLERTSMESVSEEDVPRFLTHLSGETGGGGHAKRVLTGF